jgi:hypothetical protein
MTVQTGSFIVVFCEGGLAADVSISCRKQGWSLRDTLLLIGPETVSFVLLYKIPGDGHERGIGSLDIDGCRVGTTGGTQRSHQEPYPNGDRTKWARSGHSVVPRTERGGSKEVWRMPGNSPSPNSAAGRWPPNVLVLDGPLAEKLDNIHRSSNPMAHCVSKTQGGYNGGFQKGHQTFGYGDEGSVSRFYPRFKDESQARAWVEKLLKPPEGSVYVRAP